jgi:hypothetical protein
VSVVEAETLASDQGIPVGLPSGAEFLVMTQDEHDYVTDRVQRYSEQLHLTNVSDLAQLDLMIEMELLTHRWALWMSRQKDYWDEDINEVLLSRSLNDYAGQIRQLKKALGIDKVTRDRQRGEESVAHFLQMLLIRAKEFGINREQMLDMALTLSMQLTSLLTLHDNCTEEERREQHVTAEDLLDWLRTVFIPEFMSIDDHFRLNQQRYWIRSM